MESKKGNVKMPLRENTSLMREVIDKMDYMVRVMDAEHKVIYMNQKMRQEFGHTMGHICYDLLGRSEKCVHCVTSGSKETGEPDTKDVPIGDKYYKIMSSPVSIDDGQNYSIEILNDITDQKKTEDELLKHYEKLKGDIEFAKHIQNRALPMDGDYWNMLRINSVYLPSEDLGGDFFDIIKIDENKTLLYIADVSGHGVRSSLITIFLRELIRGRVLGAEVDLNELLTHLLKGYNDLGIGEEQYLSVIFCSYDKINKEITMLNAGHNCLPLVIAKSGEIKEIVVRGMPVCNLIRESNHEQVKIGIETGDRVLLYTDGITEAYNMDSKKPFGSEGISAIINKNLKLSGKELLNKVIEGVIEHSSVSPIDDMAILVAEII